MSPLLNLFPSVNLDAQSINSLVPLLVLGIGATISLILSASKKTQDFVFWIGMILITACICLTAQDFYSAKISLSGGILVFDFFSKVLTLMLEGFTLLAFVMLYTQKSKEEILPEIYPLTLFSLAGAILLVSSDHLLFMFIALEIMSLAVYVMVAIRRENQVGAEAGMKYFILGGMASALFLYGSSMIFGATGTFYLSQMAGFETLSPLLLMGSLLVLSGILFKVGAFPFHGWLPDVYQGAMLSVTGYMGTVIKIAGFGILLRFSPVFLKVSELFELTAWIAIFTMIFGNFVALAQKELKRLLAYSSIAHTGYLLVGVLAVVKDPAHLPAVLIYLLFYGFSNLGAFAVLQEIGSEKAGRDVPLSTLEGAGDRHPLLAGSLSLFLLGMAGIPLTSGFIGKYLIFSSAVAQGLVPIVVVAVITSLVSVYYYLKIIVAMFMKEGLEGQRGVKLGLGCVLVTFVGVVVILSMGIFPHPVMDFFSNFSLKI